MLRLECDPAISSFHALLDIFFALHYPTSLKRQRNDVGTQCHAVIYH